MRKLKPAILRMGLVDPRPWPEALKAYLQEKGYLEF
jgi:hypothetical protein